MRSSRSLQPLVVLAMGLGLCLPLQARQEPMLGANQSRQLFTVDLGTGAATVVAPLTRGLGTEIELDRESGLLYVTGGRFSGRNKELHVVDPATGQSLTVLPLSPLADEGAVSAMEIVGPTLYGVVSLGPLVESTLVTIDVSSGAVTAVGSTGVGALAGMALQRSTGILFGVVSGGPTSRLVTLDRSSGAALLVGDMGIDDVGAIEFGRDGLLYGATARASEVPGVLLIIDPATAVTEVVGPTGLATVTGLTRLEGRPRPPEVPTLGHTGLMLLVLLLGSAAVVRLGS